MLNSENTFCVRSVVKTRMGSVFDLRSVVLASRLMVLGVTLPLVLLDAEDM
jgi:hypothetical protein